MLAAAVEALDDDVVVCGCCVCVGGIGCCAEEEAMVLTFSLRLVFATALSAWFLGILF